MSGLLQDLAAFAAVCLFIFTAAVLLPDVSTVIHGTGPALMAQVGEG